MKRFIYLVVILPFFVAALCSSCNKDDDDDDFKQNLYVAGYEHNEYGISVAKLWINGMPHNLTDGANHSIAYSVYVSGGDVYVVGQEAEAGKGYYVAKLWKNGKDQNLTNEFSSASSVYVSGGDVYIVGQGSCGMLWKNGIAQKLTEGTSSVYLSSVYVSGSDVYVAGFEYNGSGKSFAKLWKNGIPQNLTDGTSHARPTSVYVSGKDVYVGGEENNVAVLWKNGVLQNTGGNNSSGINSVHGLGNNVYATGTEFSGKWSAVLWKNLAKQILSSESPWAIGHSVYALDNCVYVAGTGINMGSGTKTVAKLWNNGVLQDLTDGTYEAAAYSVFVVK
jgi:hypothetical protein